MSEFSRTADAPDVLVLSRSDTLYKLVDLHVYVVPADIWRDRFNNLLNQSVTETISIGIIRVQPDVRLADLRDDIVQQLEDLTPREYVFLRSVGRSLTRLKTKQEYTMKVKHFLPPVAYAPELFLLEATGDISLASEGDSRSQSSFRQLGDSPKGNNRGYNYRDDYRDPGSRSYRDDKYNQNNGTNRLPQKYRHGVFISSSHVKGDTDDESDQPSPKYQRGVFVSSSHVKGDTDDESDQPSPKYQRGVYMSSSNMKEGTDDETDQPPSKYQRGVYISSSNVKKGTDDETGGASPKYRRGVYVSSSNAKKGTDDETGRASPKYQRGVYLSSSNVKEDTDEDTSQQKYQRGVYLSSSNAKEEKGDERVRSPQKYQPGVLSSALVKEGTYDISDEPSKQNERGDRTDRSSKKHGDETDDSSKRNRRDGSSNAPKGKGETDDSLNDHFHRDKKDRPTKKYQRWDDQDGSPHAHKRGDETYRPSNRHQHGDGTDRSTDRQQHGDGTDRTSQSDKHGDGTDRSSCKYPRGDGKDRSSHARQHGAERGPGKQGENKDRSSDPRSATYTTNTNTDSGIADSGVSPEDQYNRGRDNYEDEMARKRRDLGNRLANDKFDIDDDDTFRFEDMEDRDQIDRDRWERDREYRRRWIEEERRRREDEEARKKRQEAGEEDYDDDDDRKKMKRSESEEELARYPSPPELRMGSPRETESARQRTRQERDRLMQELENAREGRKHTEKEREELVKKAKMLQNKTQNRRNHARDIWKKRYFEEKKKTAPLEEQTNRLKHELDSIHRKLMSALEGPKEKNIRLGEPKPSLKRWKRTSVNNYIIQCTKLQHEIEDLRRRVENAKMKLTAEMKLRNQAEAELRALRAELTQKKINLTLTRNQHLAALNPSGEVPTTPHAALAPQS
ncbi:protein starmaker-like isoform X26 [Haliotis cracherodii]|uniref:protein starmaker-like isoform X26 n=1 Tax=Haliotis cracherodii TaxID=6455 RepID=UPI0039E7A05E